MEKNIQNKIESLRIIQKPHSFSKIIRTSATLSKHFPRPKLKSQPFTLLRFYFIIFSFFNTLISLHLGAYFSFLSIFPLLISLSRLFTSRLLSKIKDMPPKRHEIGKFGEIVWKIQREKEGNREIAWKIKDEKKEMIAYQWCIINGSIPS